MKYFAIEFLATVNGKDEYFGRMGASTDGGGVDLNSLEESVKDYYHEALPNADKVDIDFSSVTEMPTERFNEASKHFNWPGLHKVQ